VSAQESGIQEDVDNISIGHLFAPDSQRHVCVDALPKRAPDRDPGKGISTPAWSGYHQDGSGACRANPYGPVLTSPML
jgi:hypothetical protein